METELPLSSQTLPKSHACITSACVSLTRTCPDLMKGRVGHVGFVFKPGGYLPAKKKKWFFYYKKGGKS